MPGTTRKASTRTLSCARSKTLSCARGKTLLRASFALLRTSQDGRRLVSGSQTQRFCGNANSASPSSVARATPHPSELQPFAGTLPAGVAGTPRQE
jgi:hypothetical protein